MKRTWARTLAALLCLVMMLALVPNTTDAIGSYGVNLDSAAYTTANPFYQSGWRGQCTWYAWGRAMQLFGIDLPCRGNATTWDETCGRTVGTEPRANSVAVWESSTLGNTYGHVAYVEYVSDTEIRISEANFNNANINVDYRYSEGVFNRSTGKYVGTWNDNTNYYRKFPDKYIYLVNTTFTVSYNANGGSGAPGQQTKTQGQTLTLSGTRPTRTSSSAGSYTVTLNANGGKVSTTSLSAARTTSYTFKNWNTSSNGGGTTYAPGAGYTADANVTLYAQWNSSTSTASVTLPTPWRYGYTFKGWGTSSTATSGKTGSYKPGGNATLYAIWEKEDLSGWMTSKPNGIGDEYIETVTQYRYADKISSGGWTQTGSGTIDYVQSWPSGFNTSHSLYNQYNKTPKTAGTTGTKKVEVSASSVVTYIYWHWCFNNAYTSGGNFNVFISEPDSQYDSDGRYHQYFTAFTSASNAGHVDPNGRNGGDSFYMWRDINSDGSWWWWRIPVYRQTYKEYTGSNVSETWSDWSVWTMARYATGADRKSESRTVYRYKSNGSTGWLNLGGKWIYLNESGTTLTGWQKIDGRWFYFNSSGAMLKGWQQIGGKWYYFIVQGSVGQSGTMLTGWQKLSNKWFYFNSSGVMQTGWQKIGGKWYYFLVQGKAGQSGTMLTGWQKLSNKWYYFNASGVMQTGWLKLNEKWYYLNANGAMVTGTQSIDGKTYVFNSSGVWIP